MKLAFLHIPKTGGVSVERVIRNTGGDSLTVCPAYHAPDYQHKTYDDLPGYDFYQGHFRMDFLKTLPAEYLKVTLVRRPEDQVLSLYNHVASRPANALYERANAPGASFASLFASAPGMHNPLTRCLLGVDIQRRIEQGPGPRAARLDEILSLARANLARFDRIGTTGHLDLFISDLGDLLGQALPPPPHANRNKTTRLTKPTMTQADQEMMQDVTWSDRPLYAMISRDILPARYVADR